MYESYAERLVTTLSRPNLPNTLSTSRISTAIGAPWRELGSRLLARNGVSLALAVLGWSYRPSLGRRGGQFVRVAASRVLEVEKVLGLPWMTISKALLWFPTAA